jgi:hypothetical protein
MRRFFLLLRNIVRSLQFQLIVLAAIGLVTRITLMQYTHFLPSTPDSVSYAWTANDIVIQKFALPAIVNTVRPPVYPLFLAMLMLPQQYKTDMPISTYLIDIISPKVIFIQTYTGIITALFFFLALRLVLPKTLAFWVGCLYMTNLIVIPWEQYLLTEAFSMQLSIIAVCFILLYIKKKQPVFFYLLAVTILFLSFLRSTALVLFPVFCMSAFFIAKKRAIIPVVFSSVLFVFCIFSYISLNGLFHDYATLQFAGSINVLGRILLHNYPVPEISGNRIPPTIHQYDQLGIPKNPYDIMLPIDEEFYLHGKAMRSVDEFNKAAFRLSWKQYLQDSFTDFIHIKDEVSAWILFPPRDPEVEKNTDPRVILHYFQVVYICIYKLSIVLFFLSPLLGIYFWLRNKRYMILFCLVTLLICSQFASASLFAHEEFARLVSLTVPLLLMNAAYSVNMLYGDVLLLQKKLRRK